MEISVVHTVVCIEAYLLSFYFHSLHANTQKKQIDENIVFQFRIKLILIN